jgi:hypothetical protein
MPAEAHHREIDIACALRLWRKSRPEPPTHDHAKQVLVAHVAYQRAALHASVAQHGHTLRNLAQFGQPVRDVDHGGSSLHHLADAAEQKVGRVLVKRRRRLIKDQDFRLYRQSLGNLQQLFLGHGQ